MKVALLGVQHPHSLAHLSTLQRVPEVEQILLWDEAEQALAAVRETQGHKITGVFTNLEQLLAQDDLFLVLAAVRTDQGPAIFNQVLEAGKHLLAEKPIGRHAGETEQVVAAAERAGRTLGVCYQNRRQPLITEARDLIRQGIIGPLMSVEVRLLTTQVQFRNPQFWLFNRDRAGGGILSWLGCHYLDMIRYLTGDEIISVSAEVATRSGEAIDVEDVAALSFRFQSGAVGSLHLGYTLALSGGGYQNRLGYDVYLGLNGRTGRIYWSAPGRPTQMQVETAHPAWAGAPKREFKYELADSPAYIGVVGELFLRDFIRAAQGQGPPPASGRDALQVARIVDAAYESSRTGRRVAVVQP